jgi:hypothetical protein
MYHVLIRTVMSNILTCRWNLPVNRLFLRTSGKEHMKATVPPAVARGSGFTSYLRNNKTVLLTLADNTNCAAVCSSSLVSEQMFPDMVIR